MPQLSFLLTYSMYHDDRCRGQAGPWYVGKASGVITERTARAVKFQQSSLAKLVRATRIAPASDDVSGLSVRVPHHFPFVTPWRFGARHAFYVGNHLHMFSPCRIHWTQLALLSS